MHGPAIPAVVVPPLFSPAWLPGLEGWWSGRDPRFVTTDANNLVGQINDLTGRGRHLLQAVTGNKPILCGNLINPITTAWVNGIAGANFDTFSGGTTTGFSASHNGTGFKGARSNQFPVVAGDVITVKCTVAVNSGSAPRCVMFTSPGAGSSTDVATAAGANVLVLTANTTGFLEVGFYLTNVAGNFTLSNISVSVNYATSVWFNGSAHKLAATYAMNQPVYRVLAMRQHVWTSGRVVFDGVGGTAQLLQTGASPSLSLNAGSTVAANTGATLLSWHIVEAGFSGASSFLCVDGGTDTTGNAGAGNPGGVSLGSDSAGANFSAVQVADLLEYSYLPDSNTRRKLRKYLASFLGITVS